MATASDADRKLLMIPGPIEVSPAVLAAASGPVPGHLAPPVMEAFSYSLSAMRHVWLADESAQPFIVPGSGTTAMEMAVVSSLEPGERALVVHTGYFSARITEMLRRRGVDVSVLEAPPGAVPSLDSVDGALKDAKKNGQPFAALVATHVDTSTGVKVDAEALCKAAREVDALTIFDGVCATAAEPFEMKAWDADVYLTGSQKALGLPPGLALFMMSKRALDKRHAMKTPPPMMLDSEQHRPIMVSYEAKKPAYFATPPTTLILALAAGLREILAADDDPASAVRKRFAMHDRVAKAMRAAWKVLGLTHVADDEKNCACTLSALRYPNGVGPALVGDINKRGVIVAGGLHPDLKTEYFRVGHMAYSATRPDHLERAVRAVGEALAEQPDAENKNVDVDGAVSALVAGLV